MTHRTASRLTARAALALLLAAAGPLSPAGAADAVSQEITEMEGEGSGELVTTQTTPATFAVDLGKIDWKSF
jgi:hypothetical protein